MSKKRLCILMLIILGIGWGCFFWFSGQTPIVTFCLLENEHPELDWGYSAKDGQRVIRDFALNQKGHLFLLELSANVHEYSPQGEFKKCYDFKFAEKGLTACMLTCDRHHNFYFVDGHNCLIIKTNKKEILNIASLGEEAVVTEPGLIKSIKALEENKLSVTAISPADFLTYTYILDVSGKQAICQDSQPQIGIMLGEELSFQSELIVTEEGGLSDGVLVTIYEKGLQKNKFEVHTTINLICGLNIYGITDKGNYFAKISEYLTDGNTLQETFVLLNQAGEVVSIYEGWLAGDDLLREFEGVTYVLRFTEKGISIRPLHEHFSLSEVDNWFHP